MGPQFLARSFFFNAQLKKKGSSVSQHVIHFHEIGAVQTTHSNPNTSCNTDGVVLPTVTMN